MFKKKITIITTIISVILTMTSCGNTASSEERTNTTISYSDSSIAEEINTSSDVSSIDEVDSTEDSSNMDSIDESSETDSSEDDSSEVEKVTTTVDDSSKVEKTTTTTTTKKTTTQPVETTTTQPVVTQAPITEAPKTTTTVKQTEAPKTTTQKPVVTTKPAVQTTKTTTKATTKSTTKTTTKQTTKVTSTQPTDNKYMAAMKKISKVNAHINKDFTESDCALVREYLLNLVYKKYPKSKAHNVKFIPYFDKNGKLSYYDNVLNNGGSYNGANWQYYYGIDEGQIQMFIDDMTYLADAYMYNFNGEPCINGCTNWDIFWMYRSDGVVFFSLAVFI